MTAINIATQIPSQIVTLEQLGSWVGASLAYLNPATTAIEGPGYTERVAQSSIFYISADNRWRQLIRISLPVSADFQAGGTQKQWMFAQTLTNNAMPTIFTSN